MLMLFIDHVYLSNMVIKHERDYLEFEFYLEFQVERLVFTHFKKPLGTFPRISERKITYNFFSNVFLSEIIKDKKKMQKIHKVDFKKFPVLLKRRQR